MLPYQYDRRVSIGLYTAMTLAATYQNAQERSEDRLNSDMPPPKLKLASFKQSREDGSRRGAWEQSGLTLLRIHMGQEDARQNSARRA